MSRKGRLLIVSPVFHGYWRPIERAFARLGWEASTFCYDENAGLRSKAAVKLASELPRMLGRQPGSVPVYRSLRARAEVHARQPDRVLVIKGDELSDPFWDALDRPRIPRSLWLYDELRRTRLDRVNLSRFDTIASYSHQDVVSLAAQGIPATFVPLAFDPDVRITPRHLNEITLVGARYPKRQTTLQALHAAGVPVRAFGREWSGHLLDRLRTWRLSSVGIPSARDVTLSEAYGIMAGSPGTLNIHGDQDGFTMRTFEAAGAGGVQLIDRADVTEFYEPGSEVLPWSSLDELVDLAGRAIADDRWGDRVRAAARRRTLAEHTFDHRARVLEASWA